MTKSMANNSRRKKPFFHMTCARRDNAQQPRLATYIRKYISSPLKYFKGYQKFQNQISFTFHSYSYDKFESETRKLENK